MHPQNNTRPPNTKMGPWWTVQEYSETQTTFSITTRRHLKTAKRVCQCLAAGVLRSCIQLSDQEFTPTCIGEFEENWSLGFRYKAKRTLTVIQRRDIAKRRSLLVGDVNAAWSWRSVWTMCFLLHPSCSAICGTSLAFTCVGIDFVWTTRWKEAPVEVGFVWNKTLTCWQAALVTLLSE